MIESLQWATALIASLSLLLGLRLTWLSQKLRSHPHIESIDIAHPEIAEPLKQLTMSISQIAGISKAPSLYVRRAALPNAFIVASTLRPELYITDELLEHCDECNDGIEKLERTLCHEIAHIKRGDAISLGLLCYSVQWSSNLRLKPLHQLAQSKINHIENETDKVAEKLFKALNNLE